MKMAWLIPLGLAAYFAFALFGEIRYCALDLGDPASQLESARLLARKYNGRLSGAPRVEAPFLTQSSPKPFFDFALASGIWLGLSPSAGYYHAFIRLFALALFLFSMAAIENRWGWMTALFYGAFFVSSNAILQHVLHGGHIWVGQAFLWAAIWLGFSERKRALTQGHYFKKLARYFMASVLLVASVLSSQYMYPYAAFALLAALFKEVLFWHPKFFLNRRPQGSEAATPESAKSGFTNLSLYPLAALIAPWVLFGIVGLLLGYFMQLRYDLKLASKAAGLYPAGHDFFLNFLLLNESQVYFLILCFASIGGMMVLARESRQEPMRGALFLFVPWAVFLFLERPGALKLGRIYATLLPFLFLLASLGIERLLEPLKGVWRWMAVAGTLALVWGSGRDLRAHTISAFHAGKKIEEALRGKYATDISHLAIVGRQNPFAYMTWGPKEFRTNTSGGLKKMAAEGKEVALVSLFSNWNWLGFMDEHSEKILPIRSLFLSGAPYTPIPSVENLPFYLFINEGIYFQWRKDMIRQTQDNRLYRMRDFLSALESLRGR